MKQLHSRSRLWRRVLSSGLGLIMLFGLVPFGLLAAAGSALAAGSADIVISQVYGGGGNSGALYTHDFIELFNRGTAPVDVSGWSVQYASATGTSWQRTNLSGTIPAGGYYLVQQAAGAGGTEPLPAPDASGSIPMAATAGKVALVRHQTNLSGACPTDAAIADFVGFGGANCSEGGSPTPVLANPSAALRKEAGCQDTDNNGADFTVINPPTPRNSASPRNVCGGETPVPPEVSQLSPADLAADVPVDAAVSVTFAQPVFLPGGAASGPVGGVTVTAGGEPVGGVAAHLADNVITVTGLTLAYETAYSVTIPADSVVSAGDLGNEAVAWSFTTMAEPSAPVERGIVISQVYGGGGNSGALYKHDFVELFNPGTEPVDVTGWSVQYASATGTSWTNMTVLNGVIQPGRYYLIQQAAGTGGTLDLPTPDLIGSINLGAAAGKLALVKYSTALTGGCPTGDQIADFVGFGTTANCFEGAGPTPAPSNTAAVIRLEAGCQDTDSNAADFATVSPPTPRNSSSPRTSCDGSVPLPPEVSQLSPQDGATGVAVGTPVRASFAQPVFLPGGGSTGMVGGVTVTAGGEPVSGIGAALNGDTVTITGLTLAYETAYTVTIPAGAVRSGAGLENEAITWSFATRSEFPTLAEVRQQPVGTVVTARGVVTSLFGSEIHIQDGTGGLQLFNAVLNGYQLGDLIQVTGPLALFQGNIQISTVNSHSKLGTAPVPAPLELTIDQLTDAHLSMVVRISGLTLSGIPTSPTNSYNVTGSAGGGNLQVRIDRFAVLEPNIYTGFHRTFANGETVHITGVPVKFNTTTQVKPRVLTDVVDPHDSIAPVIVHTAPSVTPEEMDLRLDVTITDNRYVASAQAFYRTAGSAEFSAVPVTGAGSAFSFTIPGSAVVGSAVEYYITATDGKNESRLPAGSGLFSVSILPDTMPPTVSSFFPYGGAITQQLRPHVTATYFDPAGIDLASVRLKLNGTDVTAQAFATETGVSYVPATALTPGLYTATVEVADRKGNMTARSWRFTVEQAPPGQGQVLIAEALVNTRTGGSLDEFIRIYNTAAVPVSLGGWSLTTVTPNGTTATATFPDGVYLDPGQYAVAALNAAVYRRQVEPYASPAFTFEYGGTASGFGIPMHRLTLNSLTLDDNAGNVILKDAAGNEVDVLRYTRCGITGGIWTCQNGAPYSGLGWTGAPVHWPQSQGNTNSHKVLARAISEATITASFGGHYKTDTNTSADWLTAANDSLGGWLYWQNPASPSQTPLSTRDYSVGQLHSLPMPTVTFDGSVTAFLAPDTSHQTIIDFFNSATESIDLNIYQFELISIAEALVAAQSRGVQVRVLIEGQPCCDFRVPDQTKYVATLMHNAGVEVRYMHGDAGAERFRRYTNVNHAKYAVADNGTAQAQLMIFSGNFRASSMPENTASGNREWGAIIRNGEIANYFAQVFQFDFDPNQPDSVEYGYRCISGGCNLGAAPAGFVPVTANDGDPLAHYPAPFGARTVNGSFTVTPVMVPETAALSEAAILGLVKDAQESVMLEWATLNNHWGSFSGAGINTSQMPLTQELINAARRGVKVRVLLEGKYADEADRSNLHTVANLNAIAAAEGLDLQARLMPLDVIEGCPNDCETYRVIEFPGYTGMHNKGIIVDGSKTLVSSVNGTQASWLRNREAAVIIENAEIAAFFLDAFWLDWYDGETPQDWPVISEVNADFDWVEIYNPTAADIDLTGWSLVTGSAQWFFPAGAVLEAGGVLTVARDQAAFVSEHLFRADFTAPALALSIAGDKVRLLGPGAREIDRVAWNGYVQDWTLAMVAGQSLVRTNACQDTNSRIDWAAAAASAAVITCNGEESGGGRLSADARLAEVRLSTDEGELTLLDDVTEYWIQVPVNTVRLTLSATPAHAAATLTLNGDPVEAGEERTLALRVGTDATVMEIAVTAEDGVTLLTYTIHVTRAGVPVPTPVNPPAGSKAR